MPEKIKTIIVDDEPLARRNLRLLLERDSQIEILGECRNGKEAVKAIETSRPDLIFLDIQMPEMDGFDVLDHVGPEFIQAIVFVIAVIVVVLNIVIDIAYKLLDPRVDLQ